MGISLIVSSSVANVLKFPDNRKKFRFVFFRLQSEKNAGVVLKASSYISGKRKSISHLNSPILEVSVRVEKIKVESMECIVCSNERKLFLRFSDLVSEKAQYCSKALR